MRQSTLNCRGNFLMIAGENFNGTKRQISNIAARFESSSRRLSFARAFIFKIIEFYWINLNL